MGWYTVARGLLEPWIQFFRTIPPLALLPLVLVLLGIGEVPKVVVIFLAAFLACVISTYQGVVSVDRTLINAARVLGAKDGTIFARVVVPASTPFILVGMRVGLGSAWATLVAAELLAAQAGLGRRMQQAQIYYDLATIFVGIVLDRHPRAGHGPPAALRRNQADRMAGTTMTNTTTDPKISVREVTQDLPAEGRGVRRTRPRLTRYSRQRVRHGRRPLGLRQVAR